jgi:hypothetical protein
MRNEGGRTRYKRKRGQGGTREEGRRVQEGTKEGQEQRYSLVRPNKQNGYVRLPLLLLLLQRKEPRVQPHAAFDPLVVLRGFYGRRSSERMSHNRNLLEIQVIFENGYFWEGVRREEEERETEIVMFCPVVLPSVPQNPLLSIFPLFLFLSLSSSLFPLFSSLPSLPLRLPLPSSSSLISSSLLTFF